MKNEETDARAKARDYEPAARELVAAGFSPRWILLTLLLVWSTAASAQDQIQKYVGADGRVVYTNNIAANTPVPTPTAPVAATVTPSQAVAAPINELIESIASSHGVDSALVKAMVKAESNFNRWAVSSKGARGLMQLIPTTGARYGVRDFFDPRQNIEGGVTYLKFLLEKFNGNLDLSLAAYNAGENLVERLGRIPPIAETRDYVRKVLANYGKSSGFVLTTPTPAAVVAAEEAPKFYVTIDGRGVKNFTNIAPPQ